VLGAARRCARGARCETRPPHGAGRPRRSGCGRCAAARARRLPVPPRRCWSAPPPRRGRTTAGRLGAGQDNARECFRITPAANHRSARICAGDAPSSCGKCIACTSNRGLGSGQVRNPTQLLASQCRVTRRRANPTYSALGEARGLLQEGRHVIAEADRSRSAIMIALDVAFALRPLRPFMRCAALLAVAALLGTGFARGAMLAAASATGPAGNRAALARAFWRGASGGWRCSVRLIARLDAFYARGPLARLPRRSGAALLWRSERCGAPLRRTRRRACRDRRSARPSPTPAAPAPRLAEDRSSAPGASPIHARRPASSRCP
jgi:hypothetical protein